MWSGAGHQPGLDCHGGLSAGVGWAEPFDGLEEPAEPLVSGEILGALGGQSAVGVVLDAMLGHVDPGVEHVDRDRVQGVDRLVGQRGAVGQEQDALDDLVVEIQRIRRGRCGRPLDPRR